MGGPGRLSGTLPSSAERARLDELRVVAQEDRATVELALGRHAAMVAELEQLVAIHPFREGLRGLLMLALYRSGRQAEALQAWDTSRALRDELGVDPSPATPARGQHPAAVTELDARPVPIRLQPMASQDPPVPPAGVANVLVGREQQLVALQDALTEVAVGDGRVVLVAGEPGIGKTRLAEEVAQQATRGGVAVAWGRCSEEQGAPPFWPWVQVLRELLAGYRPSDYRPSWAPRDRS